jgi:DNA-binding transcriptional MerR regulator
MQQPPDPGIPGHATEHVQVTVPNVGSFTTSDRPTVGAGRDAGMPDAARSVPGADHAAGSVAGAGMRHATAGDTGDSHPDAYRATDNATDSEAGSGHAGGAGQTSGGAAGGHAGGGTGSGLSGIAGAEDVGYRGPTACHAAGISYRQLDYWARTGLVVPSVRDAAGSGSQRLYSFRDIVVLKVVKRLLDAGVSLQNIRKAIDTLRSRGVGDLAGITLISDGTTVYECRSPEEVVDLLQGGQGVFGIAISGAFKEIEGTLSHLPAEAATSGEEVPAATAAPADESFNTGDELAMRRARRRAG